MPIHIIKCDKSAMTFGELKEALSTFTPEQLAMKALWSGDNRGGAIFGVLALDEDYVNASGDGIDPVSAYADDPEAIEGEAVIQKGTTMLLVDP